MAINFAAANAVGLNNPGTEIITLVKDGSGNFINPPSYDKMRAYLSSGEVPMLFVTAEGGETGSLYQLVEYSETENKIRFSNSTNAIEFCAGCETPSVVERPPDGNSEYIRVIKTITIAADDVNSIYFNIDDNGHPFALTKRIRIRMYGAATPTGNTSATLFFRAGQTIGDSPQFNYPIKVNSHDNSYIYAFIWDLYSTSNYWYGDYAIGNNNSGTLYRFVPVEKNNLSDITVREIKLVWSDATVFFPNGATIVVEGI